MEYWFKWRKEVIENSSPRKWPIDIISYKGWIVITAILIIGILEGLFLSNYFKQGGGPIIPIVVIVTSIIIAFSFIIPRIEPLSK